MKASVFGALGLFLLLYILPLGVRPVIVPDEARYAEIPREMLVSRDWVVPRLDGLRYFEKPVLGYWLNASSMALFGQNAFAMRFPSALSAGLSALLLFLLVRRHEGGRSQAILTSMVFLTFMGVYALGTFNILDSMFSMFVTGAMFFFFLSHLENSPLRRTGFLALFGLFCGLAFLTKGFSAFAVVGVSIVPFLIWERRGKELFTIPWVPIAAALVVALPWCIAIDKREPDFWHYFFWVEHIQRFTSSTAQHSQPFWLFVPVIIGFAVPWTALFPAAVSGLRQRGMKDPFLRFALCWLVFPFLFFSASRGKVGTYILPCLPALAILVFLGLERALREERNRAFDLGALVLAVGMGMLAVALPLSWLAGFPGLGFYGPSETWKWLIAASGLLIWGGITAVAANAKGSTRKLLLCCVAPVVFMSSVPFLMPDITQERKAPGEFLSRHLERIRPDTIVVSADDPIRAVCWFFKRSDVYLVGNPGELTYGLQYPDSRHRLLTVEQLRRLIKENSGKKQVILIARRDAYQEYRREIPKPLFEDHNSRFVFAQF